MIVVKGLYGLKTSAERWYKKLADTLRILGYEPSKVDPNLWIKDCGQWYKYIVTYVDDLLITSVEHHIRECKKELVVESDMKDLRLMLHYLGLKVWQKPNEIYLGQRKYVIKILENIGMMDSKPMTTPMVTNLKNLRHSNSSTFVDPTSYR